MGKSVGLQGQQSYRPGPHKIATREQENSLGQKDEAGEKQVGERAVTRWGQLAPGAEGRFRDSCLLCLILVGGLAVACAGAQQEIRTQEFGANAQPGSATRGRFTQEGQQEVTSVTEHAGKPLSAEELAGQDLAAALFRHYGQSSCWTASLESSLFPHTKYWNFFKHSGDQLLFLQKKKGRDQWGEEQERFSLSDPGVFLHLIFLNPERQGELLYRELEGGVGNPPAPENHRVLEARTRPGVEPSAQLLFFITEDLSVARVMLPLHPLNQDQPTRGMIYRFSDWKPECPPDSGE